MSRIGQKPIEVPEGVELSISGQDVTAKGKLGALEMRLHDEVIMKLDNKTATLEPKSNSRIARQVWPTMRTLVNNIVVGVSEGYTKKLEIRGVGYRANLQGQTLVLSLGFSHEVKYQVPGDVKIQLEDQTKIEITGIDKQRVGQVAANIRGFKPPEPYKGKGIRYLNEYVPSKEGKKK